MQLEQEHGTKSSTYCISAASGLRETALEVLALFPETSVMFVNEGAFERRVRTFGETFLPEHPGRTLAYAMKANPHPRLLRLFWHLGIRTFDCASVGEISDIRRLSLESTILYNHPVKAKRQISQALRLKVRHFTVQDEDDVDDILECASSLSDLDRPIEIAIRVKTGNTDADIKLERKFGAFGEVARSVIRKVRASEGLVPGISCHVGSQTRHPKAFSEAIEMLGDIARAEGGVKTFNVGGGIPVSYFEKDNYDMREYLGAISDAVRKLPRDTFLAEPKVIIEPGRALVAEDVDMVIPILRVQERDGRRCVYIADGTLGSFSDYVIHGWRYNFQALGKHLRVLSSQKVPSTLFGHDRHRLDDLGEVQLPEDLRAGDYIHLKNAGAYSDAQASSAEEPPLYVFYNAVLRPM